ncbi:MAG: Wzz/FepE/Etk N-terminal domain-containing protein [Acidobacteriota bacterium]|nr:Wzz/FepE/Etk N-terminal domain-containing protein [Acidobacteriota bacterium]
MFVNQSAGSEQVLSQAVIDRNAIPAEPAAQEISLLDLSIVLARYRRLIVRVTLLTGLTAAIISLLLPVRYTAFVTILPPQQGGSAGSSLMAQLGSLGSVASLAGGSLGLKNPNDLQVALLKSRTVEDAMLDRFKLIQLYHKKFRSDARKKFETVVDIDNGAKTGLIRISITDSNAQRAAEMANGYVEEFKKFSATLAVSEASQRRLFFEQQLNQAKDNLAAAEEDLKRTELKTGVFQLDAQARSTIQLVADLRAQVAAKQAEITAIRSFATGQNAELQIAEQQLAGLQAQEQKMGAASEGATNALIPKGSMQEASIEYVRRLRDVKYHETIFDLLARQYEVAKVDEARQGATVQVVDRAIVPDRRSSPQRTLIVLGAIVLGLFLGVAWAFFTEAKIRLSQNPAERERLEELKRELSLAGSKRRQGSAT